MLKVEYARWGQSPEELRDNSVSADHKRTRERFLALYEIAMGSYRTFEHRVEYAIFTRFGIPYPAPPQIKHADLVALATEQRDLMPPHDDDWATLNGIEPRPDRVRPMSISKARNSFLLRYHEIIRCNPKHTPNG